MKKYFYVYLHRKFTTRELFYVGKGQGKRSHDEIRRSKHWKNVVAKHGLLVEFFAINLTEEQAHKLEIVLIRKHGRLDNGTGILVNHTDGGDGTSGSIKSAETRAKIGIKTKARMKIVVASPDYINPFEGKKHSKKTRRRLSESAKTKIGDKNPFYGKTHIPLVREIMSIKTSERIQRETEKNPNYNKPNLGRTFSQESTDKKKAAWKLKKQNGWIDPKKGRELNESYYAVCDNCGRYLRKSIVTRFHNEKCKL